MRKKAVVVYHRVDTDGVLSYAIAKRKLSSEGYDVIPQGYNYGDPLPKFPFDVDIFCMVDIGFSPDVMINLKNLYGPKLVWIDHHVSAIQNSINFGYSDLEGYREIGTAACELCWNYFFPKESLPELIKYSGTYDVWNKDRLNWDEVLAVQYGFRNRYGTLINDIDRDFEYLLSMNDLTPFIDEGNSILKYLERKWKSEVKNFAFEVTVGGKYKGICIIGTEFSSNVFNSVLDKYDIYMVCNRKGPDTFNISMYKEPDRIPEFSCAGYGGFLAGHASAAGGVINFEVFERLIKDCII